MSIYMRIVKSCLSTQHILIFSSPPCCSVKLLEEDVALIGSIVSLLSSCWRTHVDTLSGPPSSAVYPPMKPSEKTDMDIPRGCRDTSFLPRRHGMGQTVIVLRNVKKKEIKLFYLPLLKVGEYKVAKSFFRVKVSFKLQSGQFRRHYIFSDRSFDFRQYSF